MDNLYTFEKMHACRRDDLLREAQQREHYTALRAERPPVPRRFSLVEHVRQVLRWMAPRGQARLSE